MPLADLESIRFAALRRLRCSQALAPQGLETALKKALPAKQRFFSVIP
jgi:hypothetical protein